MLPNTTIKISDNIGITFSGMFREIMHMMDKRSISQRWEHTIVLVEIIDQFTRLETRAQWESKKKRGLWSLEVKKGS